MKSHLFGSSIRAVWKVLCSFRGIAPFVAQDDSVQDLDHGGAELPLQLGVQ